jgi:DNA-binding CsgD family transcriptional regulator
LEILQHIAQGQSNSDIAEQLSLSKATIQNYVSNIYAKLGIETRAEAMLYAMRHKLVDIKVGPTGLGSSRPRPRPTRQGVSDESSDGGFRAW